MSFKPINESKEDFRVYLAKQGVLDALSKVLSNIHEVQPENPLEFIHSNVAISLSQKDTIRDLESKLNDAKQEIVRLQKENDRLKQQQNRGAFSYVKNK
ncbi:CLUMA_CG015732, isoform A [Clunio marinus]|uniref:CLUMA_CG015732, isoform A n=1 Tax=Clunio marinus TaxID=568069 RepID=A0A1J1ITJ6_9DIPT|nr:CLUMA_CG015732, isoform A [Clunio marinus]